jgi:hypothetical protein
MKIPSRLDNALAVLEGANESLAENPAGSLHRWTSFNISGGFYCWDDGVQGVYLYPETFEEGQASILLRDLVETAVQNQYAEMVNRQKSRLNVLDARLDACELFRLAVQLNRRDMVAALRFKLLLTEFCRQFLGMSVPQFIKEVVPYFLMRGDGNDCSELI